jgi:hypothetical protein
MSGSASNSSTRTGVFTVTVAGDPRFIPTIRLLTSKAAEADGCSEASAARLGDAVGRILTLGLGGEPSAAGALDLRFEPTPDAFYVEIRVVSRAGADSVLERSLEARGELDTLRRLVSSAEFGAAGPHQYCRMACRRAGAQ